VKGTQHIFQKSMMNQFNYMVLFPFVPEAIQTYGLPFLFLIDYQLFMRHEARLRAARGIKGFFD
jgi:hypothetical protein